ncbi:CHASE domain-containing protein [Undibacterium sp. Ren11W]|uniref:CHASE domain-containing protein n=1 Tax=Undibacterium sp. Ren11W TaxID=3413045 RepID=UPI003BF449B5
MNWLVRQRLVIIVLACALSVTALLWQHEKSNANHELRAALDFHVRDFSARIEQRMVSYEQLMYGAQSLFATSLAVPQNDFSDYVKNLQLGANFSSMEALGVVWQVTAQQEDSFMQTAQLEVAKDFHIHPEGVRPTYALVQRIEPSTGENARMLGFDMSLDPTLQAAMERARDSGVMAVSAKLESALSGHASAQSCFMMYLPVYKKNSPQETIAQRRANLDGWVFAEFKVSAVLATLYGETPPLIHLQIYDGVDVRADNLMYDSAPAQAMHPTTLQMTEYIVSGGHTWAVVMRPLPGFASQLGRDKSALIAFVGSVLSILLALMTWQLVSGRERALTLARAMTRDLRESEARFRYLAQYDELSGLPNRAMFRDRLQQAIVQAKRDKARLALMYLDLDKFKPINDQLGHHVGDILLRAVAERMQLCVRESDTVARIGGDEFVILLPLIENDDDALRVAEKIRCALAESFAVAGGHVLTLSVSIGIAIYPEHGESEVTLAKNADNAMYKAKEKGRNQVCMFDALP